MIRRALDAVLDASIAFSFDRSGFQRHARSFRAEDLAVDLSGRVCLVTGANSGIGRATALGLARRRADVWLLCRDEERGREAEQALRRESGNPSIHRARLDVSSLASIRSFVASFSALRVDVLIHNAGVLPGERVLTAEGIESTLATHVIGPFLLTRLLEPRLTAAAGARVIFVASGGMYAKRLALDDVQWRRRRFDGVSAYAQTKRMQVVLAERFAAELGPAGVAVHAMHPGWADTPAVRSSIPGFWRLTHSILRSPEQGADTVLWLAAAEEPGRSNGLFWFDRAPRTRHLLPFTRAHESERRRLWRLCERLAAHGAESATGPEPGQRVRGSRYAARLARP